MNHKKYHEYYCIIVAIICVMTMIALVVYAFNQSNAQILMILQISMIILATATLIGIMTITTPKIFRTMKMSKIQKRILIIIQIGIILLIIYAIIQKLVQR